MKKLISFTLYGNDPKYVRGMIRNIEMREEFYPDWDIIVYHDNSVQEETLNYLSENVILRDFTDSGILAASWRFCAFDEPNVERIIVRDSDSRFTHREANAVADWEHSNKDLHVMRDHPHHGFSVMGGMWGIKTENKFNNLLDFNMRDSIIRHQGGKREDITNRNSWSMTDQHFLRDGIYRALAHPETSKIHASMDYMDRVAWNNEFWAEDFPDPIDPEKYFIGEIFVFDEQGSEQREYQYKER